MLLSTDLEDREKSWKLFKQFYFSKYTENGCKSATGKASGNYYYDGIINYNKYDNDDDLEQHKHQYIYQ